MTNKDLIRAYYQWEKWAIAVMERHFDILYGAAKAFPEKDDRHKFAEDGMSEVLEWYEQITSGPIETRLQFYIDHHEGVMNIAESQRGIGKNIAIAQ